MASLLRQLVAGPRSRHPEAGLDLCYVTDNIIATSGPSDTYPKRAYRNPLDALVRFLDSKHGDRWAIWEFRAEGTGYPDSAVYNRIWHYPWPDHHPPPFALIPNIMASMRNWLREDSSSNTTAKKDHDGSGKDGEKGKDSDSSAQQPMAEGRVVVVHCKAGKGRSGTATCAYLISEEGWSIEDALQRFTERRMRPGWGAGVSIPSQLRWLRYVVRWGEHGKIYVERQVELLELHVWGLRDGVKITVEGFVDQGRTIKLFHTFTREEREIVRGSLNHQTGFAELVQEVMGRGSGKGKATGAGTAKKDRATGEGSGTNSPISPATPGATAGADSSNNANANADNDDDDDDEVQEAGADAVFRPAQKLILPTSDINVDFERRNKAVSGWTVVTAVAHVWFNTFFEGNGPEQAGNADEGGSFEIEWDAMDGIKGSSRKGTRAFDRIAVVWKAVPEDPTKPETHVVIREPGIGEEVPQTQPADWHGRNDVSPGEGKDLGLRVSTPGSASVSRANSIKDGHALRRQNDDNSEVAHHGGAGSGGGDSGSGSSMVAPLGSDDGTAGTRAHGPRGEDTIHPPKGPLPTSSELPQRTHERAREGESPPAVDHEVIPLRPPPEADTSNGKS